MTKSDFESPEVQRASWETIRDQVFSGTMEAVARARALHPVAVEDAESAAVRDGMILTQLHMILAAAVGEAEGKLARHTMVPDDEVKARREKFIEEGRVGTSVKT